MPYLVAAVVILLAIGAAGYQGYSLGGDRNEAKWLQKESDAKEKADAEANRIRDTARKGAATLQTALGKERKLTNDLGTALQAHIRALPPPPVGCPAPSLTPELLIDWNRANAGASGDTGRGVSGAGGTTAPAAKPGATGDDTKPR